MPGDAIALLAPLLPDAPDDKGLSELLDAADTRSDELAQTRGHVAELDAGGLASFMSGMAELLDLVGRAGSYAGLDFATDTTDPARIDDADWGRIVARRPPVEPPLTMRPPSSAADPR